VFGLAPLLVAVVLHSGHADASSALPGREARTLAMTLVDDAPAGETLTDKLVRLLSGQRIDTGNLPYAIDKPIACYPEGHKSARCAVKVAETDNPAAEDYLQVYIADDIGGFDRTRSFLSSRTAKWRWQVSDDSPLSLAAESGQDVKFTRYCAQGLGNNNTFAFCAVAIGAHVVVESQVSPSEPSTDHYTLNSDTGEGNDDIARARGLSAFGVVFVDNALADDLPDN